MRDKLLNLLGNDIKTPAGNTLAAESRQRINRECLKVMNDTSDDPCLAKGAGRMWRRAGRTVAPRTQQGPQAWARAWACKTSRNALP